MSPSIDFQKLVREILPPHKRKVKRITFIYRLLAWFRKIHTEFLILHSNLSYQAKITSQVIIFEAYLVDLFGEGITILVNSPNADEAYIKHEDDEDFGMFTIVHEDQQEGGAYIRHEDDSLSIYNFIVNVPVILNADLDRMAAIINRYKVPGSTYQIIES